MINFLRNIFTLSSRLESIEKRIYLIEQFNTSAAVAISDQYKLLTNLTKSQYSLLNSVLQIELQLAQIADARSSSSGSWNPDIEDDEFIN